MATDINRVTLIGRLTRDAELKYTAAGQAVCKFSIAVNRSKKNGDQWVEEASFFDIVLWGRQGEALNQHLVKGKMVGIDGELRQDRWQQDGQNRSKVEIVANNVQLLSRNQNEGGGSYAGNNSSYGGGGTGYNGASSGAAWSQGAPRDNPAPPESPPDDSFTDDVPF